ncbi:MAG: hypothetical protein ACRD2R_04565, partial [Terriglobales bacterium]
METLYYSKMSSPIGPLVVAVSERGLARLEFAQDGRDLRRSSGRG